MDTLHDHPLLTHILSKAPGNPVLWERFLAELTKIMACESGIIRVTDLVDRNNSHGLYLHNVPPEHQTLYERKFNKQDRFNYLVAKNPYKVFCNQTIPDTCLSDVVENEFMIPYGYQYRYGLSMPYNPRYALCLYLNRSRPFASPELPRFENLLQSAIPELQKALHKEQWRNVCSQIISLTGEHSSAYIMVDRALKILYSEPLFDMMMADLHCVEMTENRLVITDKAFEKRLLAMLMGKHCQTLSLPGKCSSWLITIIPVSALENLYAWEFDKECVILTITSGTEKNATIARLMVLHQLTRCEALCALHFIETPSIADIADNSRRSVETVRNHMKKIMHKLDVHNQAALMKKLLAVVSL